MKNRKKEITLLVIGILVLVSMIVGATYAFFKAQIGPAANFNINATTGTTDNLTFSTDDDIILNITADNLGRENGDYSKSTKARARLIKSNTSESTTANYNIYLLIEENELEYSSYTKEGQPELRFMSKEEKEDANLEEYTGVPELVLSVKKGGKEQQISKRLTATDGGYDITEAEGLYAIGENVEIVSNGDVTDEWEITVTFKNLEYNQQLNTGRSLKGKIIITAEKLLYEINNADELKQLSSEVNGGDSKEGKYYVLTNNIDLGEHQDGVSNFTPIGTNDNRFKGNFNGDKYTISNLYISGIENAGLFGYVENTNISNLTINGDINATKDAGGLICYAYGEAIISNINNYVNLSSQKNIGTISGIIGITQDNSNVIIENVLNNGIITTVLNDGNAAGIIGRANYSTIKILNATNNQSIHYLQNGNFAGLVAYSYNSNIIIKNSKNIGQEIKRDDGDSSAMVGGLFALSENSQIIIEKSYNISNIINAGYSGGIISVTNSNSKIIINQCYNIGNITSTALHLGSALTLGGLLSYNGYGANAYIFNSYNKGNISYKEERDGQLGGLVGHVYTTDQTVTNTKTFIYNSYNKGNIDGSNYSDANGIIYDNKAFQLDINNVYNIGFLNGTKKYGIGITNSSNKNIENAYYLSGEEITGSNKSNIGISKSESEIKGLTDTLNSNVEELNKLTIEDLKNDFPDFELKFDRWKLGDDGYPTLDF